MKVKNISFNLLFNTFKLFKVITMIVPIIVITLKLFLMRVYTKSESSGIHHKQTHLKNEFMCLPEDS